MVSFGAKVVAGDADDPASLERVFAGVHGAFLVTNFWEHFSPERELKQAAAMARATRAAGVAHVLRLLRDELEAAMALTGCATLADASPALLDPDGALGR